MTKMKSNNITSVLMYIILVINLSGAQSVSLGKFVKGLLSIGGIISIQRHNGTVVGKAVTHSVEMTPLPFLTKLKDINKFSADMMHGDYVGAALDGVDFLETFSNLKWPIKLFLKIAEEILMMAHPIYLVIFPNTRNNGTFVDNLIYTATRSGGMVQSALKIMSIFQ